MKFISKVSKREYIRKEVEYEDVEKTELTVKQVQLELIKLTHKIKQIKDISAFISLIKNYDLFVLDAFQNFQEKPAYFFQILTRYKIDPYSLIYLDTHGIENLKLQLIKQIEKDILAMKKDYIMAVPKRIKKIKSATKAETQVEMDIKNKAVKVTEKKNKAKTSNFNKLIKVFSEKESEKNIVAFGRNDLKLEKTVPVEIKQELTKIDTNYVVKDSNFKLVVNNSNKITNIEDLPSQGKAYPTKLEIIQKNKNLYPDIFNDKKEIFDIIGDGDNYPSLNKQKNVDLEKEIVTNYKVEDTVLLETKKGYKIICRPVYTNFYITDDNKEFASLEECELHVGLQAGTHKVCGQCNGSKTILGSLTNQSANCNFCNGKGYLKKKIVETWE